MRRTIQRFRAELLHDLVPAHRAAPRVQVRDSNQGGATCYGSKGAERGKVTEVQAPLGAGAHGRTIRHHEALHARYSSPMSKRSKYSPIAFNAVEDMRVHALWWPRGMSRRANRDCLAVALRDARQARGAELENFDAFNITLLILGRSIAIVDKLGDSSQREYVNSVAAQLYGPIISSELWEIMRNCGARGAVKRFHALLREKAPPRPGTSKGAGSKGPASSAPMRVVRLPLVAACDPSPVVALARTGSHINASRLARAVITGSSAGLFRRRVTKSPQGTVLIDASCSMGLTNDRLRALCCAFPAATVAFYSGQGQMGDGAYGTLVIFAENGRRAEVIPDSVLHGSNSVDLWALTWLLSQPRPRRFVTDGGFCGGPDGQDMETSKLLACALSAGSVELVASLHDLNV